MSQITGLLYQSESFELNEVYPVHMTLRRENNPREQKDSFYFLYCLVYICTYNRERLADKYDFINFLSLQYRSIRRHHKLKSCFLLFPWNTISTHPSRASLRLYSRTRTRAVPSLRPLGWQAGLVVKIVRDVTFNA